MAVVTRQDLIIKVSWSGSAIELDQSETLEMVPEGYETGIAPPGVMLHPKKQNVAYTARIYRSKAKSESPEVG